MIKELVALDCCNNPTGLMEIRKVVKNYNLQSKNLVHKGVDFYVQNALKLTYEHLNSKNVLGVIPPDSC